MHLYCNLLRDGITATSAVIDTVEINYIQRWIASSLRGTGSDARNYHFVAWVAISDVSATDTLEEVTGGITGLSFNVINKRELSGSHIEMDLEVRV